MSIANRRRLKENVVRLFSRWLALIVFGLSFKALANDSLAPLVCDLPVTNGLIRWWPNLFDARDEITGEEGVVMGILPAVNTNTEDTTDFGPLNGSVQLKPAITNGVFTLSFWMLWKGWAANLIGQESSDTEWYFRNVVSSLGFFIDRENVGDRNKSEHVLIDQHRWHHIAIARREDGTSAIWVDGVKMIDGQLPHPWPQSAQWLTVGHPLAGGVEAFRG